MLTEALVARWGIAWQIWSVAAAWKDEEVSCNLHVTP
jgi:hypothetical protein